MTEKRRLAYVPILHTQLDMGSLAAGMRHAYEQTYGAAQWRQHERAIADFWRGLGEKIDSLVRDPPCVRIYQDGLPVCGREREIVAELAKRGSPNHEIVQQLLERGAHLEGTEDPESLVAEYRLVKQSLEILDLDERNRFAERATHLKSELLHKRDHFIGKRIGETLKPGELGILFIGLIHDVTRSLPADVQVEYVIYRLPFRRVDHRNGLASPP